MDRRQGSGLLFPLLTLSQARIGAQLQLRMQERGLKQGTLSSSKVEDQTQGTVLRSLGDV